LHRHNYSIITNNAPSRRRLEIAGNTEIYKEKIIVAMVDGIAACIFDLNSLKA